MRIRTRFYGDEFKNVCKIRNKGLSRVILRLHRYSDAFSALFTKKCENSYDKDKSSKLAVKHIFVFFLSSMTLTDIANQKHGMIIGRIRCSSHADLLAIPTYA